MNARVVLCTLASALALAACNEKKAPPATPAPASRDKVTATPSATPTAPVAAELLNDPDVCYEAHFDDQECRGAGPTLFFLGFSLGATL